MKSKNTEESPKKGASKIILPLYIILSALFIIYVAYSYLQGVVYNSGFNKGATAGQQQGYEIAVVDLMNKVSEKCEPIAITVGDKQIDVINVACLQQAPVDDQMTEVISTGE